MIRRHISAAHICLRCQIRLDRRSLPSLARRAYSTELDADHEGNGLRPSNVQSQGSQLGSNGDTESLTRENNIDTTRPREWPPEWHDDIVIRRHPGATKPPRPSRRVKQTKPLKQIKESNPKIYGYTGIKQVGNSVTLSGVDALGKNAEVLVLRDSKLKFYKAKNKSPLDASPPPENIDILARIQSERGIVSSKDVEAHINECKPAQGTIQTWDDFNGLVQLLQKSFTNPQMKKYIQSYPEEERMRKVPSLGVGILYDENAISRATPWVPETSPINQPVDDDPLRGYSPASYNYKQNIAVRILRECWQIEVPELVDGIGEVEVQVQIKDLDFLNSAYNQTFVPSHNSADVV